MTRSTFLQSDSYGSGQRVSEVEIRELKKRFPGDPDILVHERKYHDSKESIRQLLLELPQKNQRFGGKKIKIKLNRFIITIIRSYIVHALRLLLVLEHLRKRY
jgi:hypothetical protein